MKRITVGSFALIAVLGTAACNKKTDQPTRSSTSEGQTSTAAAGTTAAKQDRALVRFVNANPTLASADVWFGDTKAFADVAFKAVTPYSELPADRSTFKLRSTNTTDLATNNEGLFAGRHYTLIALHDSKGKAILRAVSDDLDAPSAGKGKVRTINASPTVGEIDIVHAANHNKEVFDAVNFDSPTSFKEVDPGAYEVRRDDKKSPPLALPHVNVQPSRFYTVIVTGDRAIESIRIEDQLGHQTASR